MNESICKNNKSSHIENFCYSICCQKQKFHPSFEEWNFVVSFTTHGFPTFGRTGRGLNLSKIFIEQRNGAYSIIKLLQFIILIGRVAVVRIQSETHQDRLDTQHLLKS